RFRAASTSTSFELIINFDGSGPNSYKEIVNAFTEERLTVKRDFYYDEGEVWIVVKREPRA
ncbi:hypothetical protein AAVH_41709, partial [Aphelenchoides avenae]